jgi:5-methylcytosine-specific restriction endonuclease McrA
MYCTKCETHKPDTEFYTRANGKPKTPCKTCSQEYSRARRRARGVVAPWQPPHDPAPNNRWCRTCYTEQPLSNFYKHKSANDGIRASCKACMRTQTQAQMSKPKRIRATKVCSHCGTRKPASAFGKDPRTATGLASQCSACRILLYPPTTEQKAHHAAFKQKHASRYAEYARARRARIRGLVLPLAPVTDTRIRGRQSMYGNKCWLCGAPADSIDHVKPLDANGYHIPANLRPACRTCNSAKKDAWPYDTKPLFLAGPQSKLPT